jgi:predicted cupin superfamily sugar epimerase
MDPELSALIARLDLRPHPEGGWYRETFRDPRAVHAAGFDGPRSASTAIYFLLAEGNFSALHRILSDEVWHHYAGGDIEVTALAPDGALRTLIVGQHAADASPQAVVAAGKWFGARVAKGGRWALVGLHRGAGLRVQRPGDGRPRGAHGELSRARGHHRRAHALIVTGRES